MTAFITKKKTRMKTLKEDIPVDVYKSAIHLHIGDDVVKMRNSIAKDYPEFGDTELEDCAALCTYKDVYCGHIWIFLTPETTIPSISHECNHAAIHIFRQHGVIIDPYNQEPFTYLQEHILSEVLEYMESKKMKFIMHNAQ